MSSSQTPSTVGADIYERASKEYDRISGDTARVIAQNMLSTSPTPRPDSVVLDNGCGTGIVAFELLESFPSSGPFPKIHAADVTPGMIDMLNKKTREKKLADGVIEAAVMDAQNLGYPDNTFNMCYMNFVLHFVPDPERGAAEMYRTLQPGGTAFVSTWENPSYLPVVNAAHKSLRPHDEPFLKSLGISDEWFTAKKLKDTLVAGGFAPEKIKISTANTACKSDSLDGLVRAILYPFVGAMESWSDEERAQMPEAMKANLTDRQRQTISFEMSAFIAVAEK